MSFYSMSPKDKIDRRIVSPAAQKRSSMMPAGFRPFNTENAANNIIMDRNSLENEKRFQALNRNLDRRTKMLKTMLDEEFEKYNESKLSEENVQVMDNISIINNKIKNLESERASLLKMYNMTPE